MGRGRRYQTTYGANKEMNAEVYALRRKVMGYIYEMKEVAEMPRVNVRITEPMKDRTAGIAQRAHTAIFIPTDSLNKYNDNQLRSLVYHEVGHAVFHLGHDENCPIMKSTMDYDGVTKSQGLGIVKNWTN